MLKWTHSSNTKVAFWHVYIETHFILRQFELTHSSKYLKRFRFRWKQKTNLAERKETFLRRNNCRHQNPFLKGMLSASWVKFVVSVYVSKLQLISNRFPSTTKFPTTEAQIFSQAALCRTEWSAFVFLHLIATYWARNLLTTLYHGDYTQISHCFEFGWCAFQPIKIRQVWKPANILNNL